MSDHIPFEIQAEVMKRLPVKSLIQFRSVSKTWKSLIDSSGFVTSYSCQQKHMFVKDDYEAPEYSLRIISVVDDDTFPMNKVPLTPPTRLLDGYCYLIGCSHGLFCFYAVGGWAVVWNPSIRRAVDVAVPNVANGQLNEIVFGFGVCRATDVPKIVKITCFGPWIKWARCIPCQVEVFTLSTGAWRSLHDNLPRKSVHFYYIDYSSYSIAADGVVYWLAIDEITMDGGCCNLIVSFDITSEHFGEVNLPFALAQTQHVLTMSKLRESLVVLENVVEPNGAVYNLWKMEGGVPKSFTNIFTFNVNTPNTSLALGFRQSGDPIIQLTGQGNNAQLVVYKPHLRQIDTLGFDGVGHSFSMRPYTETLYLLDKPDLTYSSY